MMGRVEVYFMYWNRNVKIRELFEGLISVLKISSGIYLKFMEVIFAALGFFIFCWLVSRLFNNNKLTIGVLIFHRFATE